MRHYTGARTSSGRTTRSRRPTRGVPSNTPPTITAAATSSTALGRSPRASAALQPLDAAGAIEPYLPTAHWLAWIDLYRDPILWPALREGAAVQAGYVLVAFGAAWANFATKDVTS